MSDDKEIRDVLLREVDTTTAKLENGGGSDPRIIAQGVALALRILRPLVERITVSDHECKKRMDDAAKAAAAHYAACPANQLLRGNAQTAKALIVQQFPWIGLVGYLIYEVATK